MRILPRTELFSFIFSGRKTGNNKHCLLNSAWIYFLPTVGPLKTVMIFTSLCLSLSRAFEDVQVFWRVTFDKETLSVVSNGVNLTKELVQTSGSTVCKSGEVICALTLTVRDDEVIKTSWCILDLKPTQFCHESVVRNGPDPLAFI